MAVAERWLRIPAVVDEVPVACNFVVSVAQNVGLDEHSVYQCQLAVDEACNNIIEHGYREDNSKQIIDIVCRQESDRLVISIFDDGPAFNPLEHGDPNPQAPLEERAHGGWGIYFIKRLMDEVSYQRHEGRNQLTMVKLIALILHKEGSTTSASTTSNISISNLPNDMLLVTLKGRLDSLVAPSVEAVLTKQMDLGHKFLVLNMGGVDYISSGGLKMLVSAWKQARELKGDIVLAALTPRVRDVLKMIGLDMVFPIFATLDDAIAKYKLPR